MLLTLEIFFRLTLDEFSLEHFFFEALNVIQFKFFELIANGLSVRNLILIFNLEFGLHFLVILLHLVLLHVVPVRVDFFLNFGLSVLELLLGFLFVVYVTHHHLGFKGFDLVLGFMHVLVSLSELLITKLILVVGLFSIDTAPFDLFVLESSDTGIFTPLSNGFKSVGPISDTVF